MTLDRRYAGFLLGLLLAVPRPATAQQVADADFHPPLLRPAFEQRQGPRVVVDAGHHNFHTVEGRYVAFADLLRRDGYTVASNRVPITENLLVRGGARILVIANAIAAENEREWVRPIHPAFTPTEVDALIRWIRGGGSLLLIIDHFPMPGASEPLTRALGLEFRDGYALRPGEEVVPEVFSRATDTLKDHAITRGRDRSEEVASVATFTGSAFRAPQAADPLLILRDGFYSFEPDTAGVLTSSTPRTPVGGWLQGAAFRLGEGRVAVFGEAAMFTAQLAGPDRQKMGMNNPAAEGNPQFLLNVIHWLTGLLDGP